MKLIEKGDKRHNEQIIKQYVIKEITEYGYVSCIVFGSVGFNKDINMAKLFTEEEANSFMATLKYKPSLKFKTIEVETKEKIVSEKTK